MHGSVYADTSWPAKLYLYESESADCIAYLNSHRGSVYVSQLSDVEVTAAISKSYSSPLGPLFGRQPSTVTTAAWGS